ncbi:TetR/AcrR family transcriptional regulator [Kitasatospora sp. NPDC054939]
MPRPPRYDDTVLLDAAVRLAATSGPAAVTMSAVARASGAPNGSVYHRFPHRAVLLAELWLRSVGRFQQAYLAELAAHREPMAAARAGARHVVAWSRAHPEEAVLLLHGPHAFGRADWPAEYAERADADNRRVFGAVAELGGRLGAADPVGQERVALALVDLPLALVRRHLRDGGTLPAYAEELAEHTTTDLLTGLGAPTDR